MNEKTAEKPRNKTADIDSLGILALSVFFNINIITILCIFLANLKLD